MKRKLNKAGFSLVEVLVYLSLATMITVVLTSFMIDVAKHAALAKSRQEVQFNAQNLLTRIANDVRHAQLVTAIAISGQKKLELVNRDGQVVTYNWDDAADHLWLTYDNGSGQAQLSSADVKVTLVEFSNETNKADEVTIKLRVVKGATIGLAVDQYELELNTTATRRLAIY